MFLSLFLCGRNRIALTSSPSDVADRDRGGGGGGGEDGIWAIQTPAFHFALLDQTLFACQGSPHLGEDLNGFVFPKSVQKLPLVSGYF